MNPHELALSYNWDLMGLQVNQGPLFNQIEALIFFLTTPVPSSIDLSLQTARLFLPPGWDLFVFLCQRLHMQNLKIGASTRKEPLDGALVLQLTAQLFCLLLKPLAPLSI